LPAEFSCGIVAGFAWESECPTQAKGRLEWATRAFSLKLTSTSGAEARMRFRGLNGTNKFVTFPSPLRLIPAYYGSASSVS
jgi:hypothetical protein